MSRIASEERNHGEMRFAFSWTLLGLVIERPSYGYELVQRFERVYGDTLTLSSPRRIYLALEELDERGLIERTEAHAASATSRTTKTYYQATDKGIAAYEGWLVGQLKEERQRAWVFSRQLSMLEPDDALEVLDRYEHECLEELALAEQREQEEEPGPGAEGAIERLTRTDERLALGVRLSWSEYVRHELRGIQEQRDSIERKET